MACCGGFGAGAVPGSPDVIREIYGATSNASRIASGLRVVLLEQCGGRLLPAPTQIPAQRAPGGCAEGACYGGDQYAISEHVEQGLGPGADGVAGAVDHGVDKVLGLVFTLGVQRGE